VRGQRKGGRSGAPVLAAYAKRVVHVGKSGAGQTAKMANQMCIAGAIAGLSEAIRFAQAARLDLDKVFEAISGGAAQSWQMDNRFHSMARDEFDFGFAVDWMRRTLGLPSRKPAIWAPACPPLRSSTSSMPKCRPWAAPVRIPAP
jgi:3-hydroxyisobutyrate dehydrogenase